MTHPALSPFRALAPRAVALVALLLAGCSESAEGARAEERRAPSASVEAELRDLVRAVTPPTAEVPAGERNAWFGRRKRALERMRALGPEVGRAALAAFEERDDAIPEVRAGLLDVAAHAAPEEARPVLISLVSEYGEDLGLRKKAAALLGATSPETALEVLGPILETPLANRTDPPADELLEAWLVAARAVGRDPVPLLARVLTDLAQPSAARTRAARALGETADPVGRQALESALVESTGDHYLRRIAAQSLARTVPAAELCPRLEEVLSREADPAFQAFLSSMIQNTCR
jgi:hypothetical protein